MKRLVFAVTNDLAFDQRMQRICASLQAAGYEVTLIGRKRKSSPPLPDQPFTQQRMRLFFDSGALFYTEYNLRLFLRLLFIRADLFCAIDLDTILAVWAASALRRKERVYDAHEYFTEMVEVLSRPRIYKFWKTVERFALPRFVHGYTVGEGLQTVFREEYGKNFAVVRSLPRLADAIQAEPEITPEPYIFIGGAVNEGRAWESLLPALMDLPYRVVVAGDGNYMHKLRSAIGSAGYTQIELLGMLPPHRLRDLAASATLGITLYEPRGRNQTLVLPNKFWDYMHAGLPQIAPDFAEFRRINEVDEVALLLPNVTTQHIQQACKMLMNNAELRQRLRDNALRARERYNWEGEEKTLVQFYRNILGR